MSYLCDDVDGCLIFVKNRGSGEMIKSEDATIVRKLRMELHQQLADIDFGSRYATVNIPAGSLNIGSHLLWLSECLYFSNIRNTTPVYASSAAQYSKNHMRDALGNGVIVLRSGYIGDQWDSRGGKRRPLFESIIRDFPDNRIVFMPHSMEYLDPFNMQRASEIFAKHSGITFLARDNRSFENVRRDFPDCKLGLSPDIVLHLTDVIRSCPNAVPAGSILFLCRDDWDGGSGFRPERLNIPGLVTHEWRTEPDNAERDQYQSWRSEQPLPELLATGAYTDSLEQAMKFLHLAINQLRRHRLVITNRLHGHIMCAILGIPHIIVPGPYHKMTSFYRTWTRSISNCRFVSRGDQVRGAAAELLEIEGDSL